MQDHIINDQIADLARAMLELDNMDEAYRFFEDIFTIHELQAVAQRLAVARLLQKKVTYQEIARRPRAGNGGPRPGSPAPPPGAGGYSSPFRHNKCWEGKNEGEYLN